MADSDNPTFREINDEFFDGFTSHGFARIYKEGRIIRRIAWFIICFICLIYSAYLSYNVILEYTSYPKSVTITTENDPIATFPAVTICNLNPLVKEKEKLSEAKIWKHFLELENDTADMDCSKLKYDSGFYALTDQELLEQSMFNDLYDDYTYSDYYDGSSYYGGSSYYNYYNYYDYNDYYGSSSATSGSSFPTSSPDSGSTSDFGSTSGSGSTYGSGSTSGSGRTSSSGINPRFSTTSRPQTSYNTSEVIFDTVVDTYMAYNETTIDEHRRMCSNVYPILLLINNTDNIPDPKENLKDEKCPISDFKEQVKFSIACKTDIIYDVFGAYTRDLKNYTELSRDMKDGDYNYTEYQPNCTLGQGKWFAEYQMSFNVEDLDKDILKNILSASRTTDLSDVMGLYVPDEENIKNHSLSKQEFILSCSFDNQPCSFKDFYEWTSESLGKCYTFNSVYKNPKQKSTVRMTPLYGPSAGLRLTLDVNAKEYLHLLSPHIGLRVVVHHKNVLPFPDEEGINVTPSFTTSLIVSRKVIKRVGEPWGKCRDADYYFKGQKVLPSEKYLYTLLSCQKLCRERLIRENCGCSFAKGPIYSVLKTMAPHIPKTLEDCSPFNYTQKYCIEGIRYKQLRAELDCNCLPPCYEIVNTPNVALSEKNSYYYRTVQNMKKIKGGDDICGGAENETVRLQVYLDSLQYEKIEEFPSYTFPSFLSNMGGSLGLFMGFSVITICEVIELLINYTILLCKRTKGKVRNEPMMVKPKSAFN